MITEHPKNHLKPLFLLCENDVAQLVTINVAQLVTIKMAKRGPVSNFTAFIYIYMLAYIYIYTYGVRPICRLHFDQKFQFSPVL